MRSVAFGLLLLGQTLPPSTSAAAARTEWLVSTVGNSEWCPAGNVRLDLQTGTYAFTPRAPRRNCNDAALERPVLSGVLDAERGAAVRAAYRRAAIEGLTDQSCREGGRPSRVVVGNGGPRILVLATGQRTTAAPSDLSCWSPAADALYQVLNETFSSSEGR